MPHTYIIGEIGQNHNGSVDIAKLIIDKAASAPKENHFNLNLKAMDAIKLTKRDLKHELSETEWKRPYLGINSFGRTYGEHRTHLELSDEDHYSLYKYATSLGLDVIETLCSPSTLSLLKLFTPVYIKIASRDLKNHPLLAAIAETKIPVILSTGMACTEDLDISLNIINKYHDQISILHCVSQYPTNPSNLNLLTIPYLIKRYPQFTIGYSDHTIGISTPIAAVALGAKIIEKHITIDRSMKGIDQACSLGIDGIGRLVRDIRLLDLSMGVEECSVSPGAKESMIKLERSIAFNKRISKGDKVHESDLILLSPGDGLPWSERFQIIGKIALEDINPNIIVHPSMLL